MRKARKNYTAKETRKAGKVRKPIRDFKSNALPCGPSFGGRVPPGPVFFLPSWFP
jgi:hypothetical protein